MADLPPAGTVPVDWGAEVTATPQPNKSLPPAGTVPVDWGGDDPKSGGFWNSNVGAGIERMPGAALSAPGSISELYSQINPSALVAKGVNYMFPDSTAGTVAKTINDYNPVNLVAKGIANYWPSEKTITNTLGMHPAEPDGLPGKIVQDTIAGAPLAALGGGGLLGFATRQAANLGGTTAADAAGTFLPDQPLVQAAAGVAGSALGHGIASATGNTGSWLSTQGRKILHSERDLPTPGDYPNPNTYDMNSPDASSYYPNLDKVGPTLAGQTAAQNLVKRASGQTADQLIQGIQAAKPDWSFSPDELTTYPDQLNGTPLQPHPNLAAVLPENLGIRNMVYQDQTKSPTPYQQGRATTDASQRQAVAVMSPEPNQLGNNLGSSVDERNNQVGNLPIVRKEDAGADFRGQMQDVMDQRKAAQKAAGTPFDALENSPAQISLQPVIDYATEQAAKSAGPIGDAYKSAAGAFRSGTGITLDTAPFAKSVLSALDDLASGAPAGSAAQRAFLDVKNRASAAIEAQAPEVTAARAGYAQASEPLDIFKRQPFKSTLQTDDRYTSDYKLGDDRVVQQFLEGSQSASGLANLHRVFGNDPEASAKSLTDYIASEVKNKAVDESGNVNPQALSKITDRYQNALFRFPKLKQQLSNLDDAQAMVDHYTAQQRVSNALTNELGVGSSNLYSPKAFKDFLGKNAVDIDTAYGPQGTATLGKISKQLSDIASVTEARAPGTSGTAQSIHLGGVDEGEKNILGAIIGENAGDLISGALHTSNPILGGLAKVGTAALGAFTGGRIAKFNNVVDAIQRQALVDPIFAQRLLEKYSSKLPSKQSQNSMQYVRSRLSGYLAPQLNAVQQQQQ